MSACDHCAPECLSSACFAVLSVFQNTLANWFPVFVFLKLWDGLGLQQTDEQVLKKKFKAVCAQSQWRTLDV